MWWELMICISRGLGRCDLIGGFPHRKFLWSLAGSLHLQGKFLWSLDRSPPITSHRTFKTYPVTCRGSSSGHFVIVKTITINMIYSFLSCFQGPPLFPKLDFGLCARVFSAGFLPLEPTILFSDSSAVSHLKPRDFRFHEPAILFIQWSAVSHTGNDMTSSICSRPIRSLHMPHTSPLYYLQTSLKCLWWKHFPLANKTTFSKLCMPRTYKLHFTV